MCIAHCVSSCCSPKCMSQKGKLQNMWVWQVSLQDMSIRHHFAIVTGNGAFHPRTHKHVWRTFKRTGLFIYSDSGRPFRASMPWVPNRLVQDGSRLREHQRWLFLKPLLGRYGGPFLNWSQDADLGELVTLYAQRHWAFGPTTCRDSTMKPLTS